MIPFVPLKVCTLGFDPYTYTMDQSADFEYLGPKVRETLSLQTSRFRARQKQEVCQRALRRVPLHGDIERD